MTKKMIMKTFTISLEDFKKLNELKEKTKKTNSELIRDFIEFFHKNIENITPGININLDH